MVIEQSKFPFKYMQAIIDNFDVSGKIATIDEIRRVAGACYPDTAETMSFVEYITGIGKIEKTSEGWVFIGRDEGSVPRKPTRDRYLTDFENIVRELKTGPKSTDEIAKALKIKVSKIQSTLEFLEHITKVGPIVKIEGSPRRWKLET